MVRRINVKGRLLSRARWSGGAYLRKRSGTWRIPKGNKVRPMGIIENRARTRRVGVERPFSHVYDEDVRVKRLKWGRRR